MRVCSVLAHLLKSQLFRRCAISKPCRLLSTYVALAAVFAMSWHLPRLSAILLTVALLRIKFRRIKGTPTPIKAITTIIFLQSALLLISSFHNDEVEVLFDSPFQETQRAEVIARDHIVPPYKEEGVTAVVPFKTGIHFLKQTLSVLDAQTLPLEEIVVVADHVSMLDSYQLSRACDDTRRTPCRIVHLPSSVSGLPAARNHGLEQVITRFVLFVDADDYVSLTSVETGVLYTLTHSNKICALKGWTIGFGYKSYVWGKWFDSEGCIDTNCVTSTSLQQTDILRQAGGYDENLTVGLEDWKLWKTYMTMSCSVVQLGIDFDWYRQRPPYMNQWWRANEQSVTTEINQEFQSLPLRFDPRPEFQANPDFTWRTNLTLDGNQNVVFDRFRERGLHRARYSSSSKYRVLIVSPWIRTGGADEVSNKVINALLRENIQVTVVTLISGMSHPTAKFRVAAHDVLYLADACPTVLILSCLQYVIESRRITSVISSNSQLFYYALPSLYTWNKDVLFYSLDHMPEPHWRDGGHARSTAENTQYFSGGHIVISNDLKIWLSRWAPESHIYECRNGVETVKGHAMIKARNRKALTREHDIPIQTVIFLFPHRLEYQKNPLLAVEITKHVSARLKQPVFLLFSGDGSLRDEVNHAAQLAGINFAMKGTVTHDTSLKYISGADFILQPSESEGLSLVTLEALSFGTIVVSTNVGAQREALDGIYPFASGQNTSQSASDIIIDILSWSKVERKRAVTLGLERIMKNFSVETFSECIVGSILEPKNINRAKPVSSEIASAIWMSGVAQFMHREA